MPKQKIVENPVANFIEKAIVVLLYAALVTPLLVSSEFFFPFITTKTLFFRLIVEITFALYVILIFIKPQFRPRWSLIEKAVVAYVVVVFATSVFGVNFYRSFWGNVERGEGIVTLLHIAAYFLVLANIFWAKHNWQNYFGASVIVAILASVYALLQRYGVESLAGFRIVPGDAARISGTIGNAAFFAGYIMMNAFFAVWIFFTVKNAFLKYFSLAAAIFLLWIVNATQTRGALLGLAIGTLVMAFLFALTSRRLRIRQASIGLIILLFVAGAGLWLSRDSEFVKKTGGLYRLVNIERQDITTESRLLTWQASLNGWQDRFFVGYGYENFNVAFNKYFPAKIFRDSGSQIWFDRAHNAVLDSAVQSGIFGLLSYLGIFASALFMLLKYYRSDTENNRTTAILFLGLLISYFVQNLFVFDTLGTYIAFFSVLAFIISIKREQDPIAARYAYNPIRNLYTPYASAGIAAVLLFTLYAAVVKPAQANIKVTKALYATATQNITETVAKYKEAVEMGTYVTEEARQKFGEAMIGFRGLETVSADIRQRAFRAAIEELQNAKKASPLDARNYLFLMAVYNNQPILENKVQSSAEVIHLGKEALELSPTRPQIYFEMGQAAFSLGRFDEGLGYFEKAVELNEYPAESHFNLALAYYIADKPEAGRAQIKYLTDNKNISIVHRVSLSSMIQILVQKNYLPDTIVLYQELLRREPNNETLQAELLEVQRRITN